MNIELIAVILHLSDLYIGPKSIDKKLKNRIEKSKKDVLKNKLFKSSLVKFDSIREKIKHSVGLQSHDESIESAIRAYINKEKRNLKNEGLKIDLLIVSGDLTAYGSEESMKSTVKFLWVYPSFPKEFSTKDY